MDDETPIEVQITCACCGTLCVEDPCPVITCKERYRSHRHMHCPTAHPRWPEAWKPSSGHPLSVPFIVIVRINGERA